MLRHQVSLLGYEHTYYQYLPDVARFEVVGLHGFGNSGRSFRHFATELKAAGVALHAPDLLGFGQTAKPPSGYSFEQYAQLTLAFCDHLGLKKPVLMGHSFGGMLSLATVLQYPDRFSGLIMMAPGGFHPLTRWQVLADRRMAYRFMRSPLFSAMVRVSPLRAVLDTPETMEALLRLYRSHRHLDLDHTGLRPKLPDLAVPSLILWGDQDRILPKFVQNRIQKQLPQAYFHLIHQAGHALLRDQPHATAEAISTWLGHLALP